MGFEIDTPSVFEVLANDTTQQRVASRRALALAHVRVESSLGSFLRGAQSEEEFEQRLALVRDDFDAYIHSASREVGHEHPAHIAKALADHYRIAEKAVEFEEPEWKREEEEEDEKVAMVKEAPGKQHLPGASPKRNRQYEHIKEQYLEDDEDEETAKELAARTVNKQRAQHGETKKKKSSWQVVAVEGEQRSPLGKEAETYWDNPVSDDDHPDNAGSGHPRWNEGFGGYESPNLNPSYRGVSIPISFSLEDVVDPRQRSHILRGIGGTAEEMKQAMASPEAAIAYIQSRGHQIEPEHKMRPPLAREASPYVDIHQPESGPTEQSSFEAGFNNHLCRNCGKRYDEHDAYERCPVEHGYMGPADSLAQLAPPPLDPSQLPQETLDRWHNAAKSAVAQDPGSQTDDASREVSCPECGGSGKTANDSQCPKCNGSGKVSDFGGSMLDVTEREKVAAGDGSHGNTDLSGPSPKMDKADWTRSNPGQPKVENKNHPVVEKDITDVIGPMKNVDEHPLAEMGQIKRQELPTAGEGPFADNNMSGGPHTKTFDKGKAVDPVTQTALSSFPSDERVTRAFEAAGTPGIGGNLDPNMLQQNIGQGAQMLQQGVQNPPGGNMSQGIGAQAVPGAEQAMMPGQQAVPQQQLPQTPQQAQQLSQQPPQNWALTR